MKFIKYENIFGGGAINLAHIVELHIERAFMDGKPLHDDWGVVAQLSFGQGSRIIFIGDDQECENYIDNLIKEI